MEEYSGEDLQIIACPSTEQVQLTGNWHILITRQQSTKILWRPALVRHWSSLCASFRLISCCLWISNVPVLACGFACERSTQNQELRSWAESSEPPPLREPDREQQEQSDAPPMCTGSHQTCYQCVEVQLLIVTWGQCLFVSWLDFIPCKLKPVLWWGELSWVKSCVSQEQFVISLTSICTGCEGVGVKYIRGVQT